MYQTGGILVQPQLLILKTFNMANMKNGLSYFEEGGEVQQPTALTKPVTPKGAFAVASPVGAIPMSAGVLENMQKLLDQKQAQQGSFAERLKDVKAVFTGSGATQSQAMDTRNKQRESQRADIFQMQNQLAQQKAAQAQLANISAEDEKSGWGRPQAGGAPTANTSPVAGAVTPGAAPAAAPAPSPVDGAPNPEIVQQYQRILYTEGVAAANKFKNEYLREKSKASFNPNLDPMVKFPINGQMVDMPLSYAQRMSKNNPQLQMLLEKMVPGSTTAAPAAAPAAAPGVTNTPTVSAPGAPSAAPAAPKPTAAAAPAAATTTPIRTPSATVGGGPLPSSADITQRMEIEKEREFAKIEADRAEQKKTGEDIALQRAATVEAGGNAQDRLASIDYLGGLITTNPRAFGVLQRPGVMAAVLSVAQDGVNAGQLGAIGLKNLDEAIRKVGGTQQDIDAAQKAAREFALMQLNAAKIYLKGQGAVSDAERNLIKEMAGSTRNSPAAIRDFLEWNRVRADFDYKNGQAYSKFNNKYPNVSYEKYKQTPEYKALKTEYENNIRVFGKSTQPKPAQNPGQPLLDKYPARKP
jgi:hypothetical protein